jgi:hypothetical protein
MRRAAVVLLAPLIAACGASSPPAKPKPPTAEQQVRAAAKRVLGSRDADKVCGTLVTAHFLQTVFAGDRDACISNQADDTSGTGVRVESVAIRGASAHAAVRTDKGVTGTLAFAREGRQWKLDDFGTDYLRASLLAGIDQADKGALAEPSMKTCAHKQVTKVGEKELRFWVFSILRKDKYAKRVLLAIAARCPDPLATYVTKEIVDGVDGPPRYTRCLRRWIGKLLRKSKVSIAALADVESEAGKTAVKALVLGAGAYCTIS